MNPINPDREGKPGLIPHTIHPENLESPLIGISSWITPNELFYLRNHLNYPTGISLETWYLQVDGRVASPMKFNYQELRQMPAVFQYTTLECSGNKRGLMEPPAPGDQWKIGGIGNAKWTGIPLKHILTQCGLKDNVREIVFTGIDTGRRPDMPGIFYFVRSLPLKQAMADDVLLVLDMNDEPLPFKHGFPLRLLVPGWYAMASVKWLGRITAISGIFQGPFQTADYVYLPKENDYEHAVPVTEMKINSVIISPNHLQEIKPGLNMIRGLAWSGNATIRSIEVSMNGGYSWEQAKVLNPEHSANTWTYWKFPWRVTIPGEYDLMVKATDSKGRTQPWEAPWNAKGYGNNSMHKVTVKLPSLA